MPVLRHRIEGKVALNKTIAIVIDPQDGTVAARVTGVEESK